MHKNDQPAGRAEITYFTDPLCCWSWAMEPQWRKLLTNYHHVVSWQYIMAGLLPDWKNYNDPENHVSKPIQMGPVWMHASQITGMPMNNQLWFNDPPASSYPACIAYACIASQSTKAADIYLRRLREEVMINGKNIAKTEVLLQLAEEQEPSISISQFKAALLGDAGIQLFHQHLDEVRKRQINRYPTLLFRAGNEAYLLTGYQVYQQLEDVLLKLLPQTVPMPANVFPWLQPTLREQEELEIHSEKTTVK